VVEATKGGIGGGGARLTLMGREVLALYRAMEDHAATAVSGDMEAGRRGTGSSMTQRWREMDSNHRSPGDL